MVSYHRKLLAAPGRDHLPDKVLYRDEGYFQDLQQQQVAAMTAPPQEQGDSGPLVPCKVISRFLLPDLNIWVYASFSGVWS